MERPFSTLGRHCWAGVGLAFLAEAAILAGLGFADPSEVVGIPAAVAAAIAGSVAVAFGPWDGALVALGGAVVFGRVRELAVDLRPRALDDFGLPAAAQRLAATFSERTGVAVEVELDEQAERLPTEIELALFRVLQEALHGVSERTDATRVRVTLTRTARGAVFEVADNGSVVDAGIADDRELVSARERLRLLGGRLTIVTPPGAGTIVRAAVPA
jgi:signal transduction histidine kinase